MRTPCSMWASAGLPASLWPRTSVSHRVFTKVVRPVPDAPTTIMVNWTPFLTLFLLRRPANDILLRRLEAYMLGECGAGRGGRASVATNGVDWHDFDGANAWAVSNSVRTRVVGHMICPLLFFHYSLSMAGPSFKLQS
jgi:hypothetical protein